MISIKNSKILVTGGTGFIGGHLVGELVASGAKVAVIDIKVHPKSTFALNNLKNKVLLKLIDIRDKEKVFGFFKKFKPDYIFHLAANQSFRKHILIPTKHLKQTLWERLIYWRPQGHQNL